SDSAVPRAWRAGEPRLHGERSFDQRERAIRARWGIAKHIRELVGPGGCRNTESGVEQMIIEVRGSDFIRVQRADVVVVAESERAIEGDQRRCGSRRRLR